MGVSSQPGVCLIPSIGNFFGLNIVIFGLICSQFFCFILLFIDVVFDTFELIIIFDMITGYI